MKFQVLVQGMTCNGCKKMVGMTLGDHFSNVDVDLASGRAVFESDKDLSEVQSVVGMVAQELDHYTFGQVRSAS